MPRVSDLLYRFRPSGAPGSAASAGVPADRAHDLALELEPLFARLAQTERECRDVLEEGRRAAEHVRARDAAAVQRLLATAAPTAAAERARAFAVAQGAGAAEIAATEASANHQIRLVRRRYEGILPSLLEEVAAGVLALVGGLDKDAPADPEPPP
jgi:hypothetical protein